MNRVTIRDGKITLSKENSNEIKMQEQLVIGIIQEINDLLEKRATALEVIFGSGIAGYMNVMINLVSNAVCNQSKKGKIDKNIEEFIDALRLHKDQFKINNECN